MSVASAKDDDVDDPEKSQCGFFGCRPDFLKPVNTPPVFLALFSLTSFCMMMSIGINAIMAPTLESLFNISSTEMGFIFTANDLSGVLAALVLGNFCASRKIKWITFGMYTIGLAGLVTASTQLFVTLPEIRLENETRNSTAAADRYAVDNYKLYWMHVAGALLQGIGLTPPGISGTTYMDEIFTQKKFGVAVAVLALIGLMGFPLSYIVGTYFLQAHVTLSKDTGITRDHPQWIGAWWLGYFIPGVLLILLAIPISLFPQQMPAAKKVLRKKIAKGLTSLEEKSLELNKSTKEIIKDMVPMMKRLSKNISFDFMLAGDTLMFLYYGSTPYWPKLFAIIYKMDSTLVGKYLGYSRLTAFITGISAGGLMSYLRDYTGRQAALITAICGMLSVPFLFGVLLYCPVDTIVGVDVPYVNASMPSLIDNCQHNDNSIPCDTTFLTPLCSDGLTYLSPCHAGCSIQSSNTTSYTDCTCIPSHTAEKGGCGGTCYGRLWTAIIITSVGNFIALLSVPAHNIVGMRIVSEADRTVSQGVRSFMTRILGTLPAPLLFGAIIDSYCTVWRYTDGVRGNCWVYDIDGLMFTYIMLQFGIRFLSALCHFGCWWWYPQAKGTEQGLELENKVNNGYTKLPSVTVEE